MAKEQLWGQWWEQLKNPPKWVAPAYLVTAILTTGLTVFYVVRDRDWFVFPGFFALFFWFNAWGNWYQRGKVSDSQRLQPDKGQAKADWWPLVSLILHFLVAFAVLLRAGIS